MRPRNNKGHDEGHDEGFEDMAGKTGQKASTRQYSQRGLGAVALHTNLVSFPNYKIIFFFPGASEMSLFFLYFHKMMPLV